MKLTGERGASELLTISFGTTVVSNHFVVELSASFIMLKMSLKQYKKGKFLPVISPLAGGWNFIFEFLQF